VEFSRSFDLRGFDSMMALLGGLVWQTFVRQRGQAKTGVGDSDALCVVGEHLGCDIEILSCTGC
jgi:hypothetical protein